MAGSASVSDVSTSNSATGVSTYTTTESGSNSYTTSGSASGTTADGSEASQTVTIYGTAVSNETVGIATTTQIDAVRWIPSVASSFSFTWSDDFDTYTSAGTFTTTARDTAGSTITVGVSSTFLSTVLSQMMTTTDTSEARTQAVVTELGSSVFGAGNLVAGTVYVADAGEWAWLLSAAAAAGPHLISDIGASFSEITVWPAAGHTLAAVPFLGVGPGASQGSTDTSSSTPGAVDVTFATSSVPATIWGDHSELPGSTATGELVRNSPGFVTSPGASGSGEIDYWSLGTQTAISYGERDALRAVAGLDTPATWVTPERVVEGTSAAPCAVGATYLSGSSSSGSASGSPSQTSSFAWSSSQQGQSIIATSTPIAQWDGLFGGLTILASQYAVPGAQPPVPQLSAGSPAAWLSIDLGGLGPIPIPAADWASYRGDLALPVIAPFTTVQSLSGTVVLPPEQWTTYALSQSVDSLFVTASFTAISASQTVITHQTVSAVMQPRGGEPVKTVAYEAAAGGTPFLGTYASLYADYGAFRIFTFPQSGGSSSQLVAIDTSSSAVSGDLIVALPAPAFALGGFANAPGVEVFQRNPVSLAAPLENLQSL